MLQNLACGGQSYLYIKPIGMLIGRDRCPTGEFNFTPLHAAGTYPNGPHFSDYFVSSYTPTVNALFKAQNNSQELPSISTVKVLLASVEHTSYPGACPLPGTVQEISVVKACLDDKQAALEHTENAAVLYDTKSKTLQDEIVKAGILHLACHGIQDTDDPLQSGFLMADEKLTIKDLMKLDLPKAFLAILSACHTARGDDKQPDQTVHLAATMLFLGFRSVVATLWYVLIFSDFITALN